LARVDFPLPETPRIM